MQRVAFERRDDEERQLTILTDLLNNIYKKALRTKKFDVSCFVNTALTSMLAMFNFGMGAKSL